MNFIAGGTITESMALAYEQDPDNENILSILIDGIPGECFIELHENTPDDCCRWLKQDQNDFHDLAGPAVLAVDVMDICVEIEASLMHEMDGKVKRSACPSSGPLCWRELEKAFVIKHYSKELLGDIEIYRNALAARKILDSFRTWDRFQEMCGDTIDYTSNTAANVGVQLQNLHTFFKLVALKMDSHSVEVLVEVILQGALQFFETMPKATSTTEADDRVFPFVTSWASNDFQSFL